MSNTPPPIKPLKQFPADSRVLAAELKPVLDGIERGRQKALQKMSQGWKRIGLGLMITLVVTALFFAILAQSGGELQLLALTPILAGVIFCFITHGKYISGHRKVYRDVYKQKVIGGMASLLHVGMSYTPERGISQTTFKQAGLYNTGIDRYNCEDLFAGKVGQTEIMFSEVHAEDKRKRTNSKGHSETYWVTIFKGLFLIADFHKDFRSWLTIKPDFAESSFGWFGRKIQGFKPNLIRLESPEFEKAFVVHGSDQVEARYILTPDMQERLLTLRNNYGTNIRLSLQNSQLNLAIPQSDDWFEPNMKIPAHELSQMQMFVNQMTHVFSIVEMLNLNTRIWSKT